MWIRTIRSRVLGAGALRRKSKKNKAAPELEGAQTARPKGFDDFELRLGDTMRGERATIGKSLLDVQRDLKIKASYISAIENCDPGAFDTPGFVAGYVRSYAKYLGMDSEEVLQQFCAESGFQTVSALAQGSSAKKPQSLAPLLPKQNNAGSTDIFKTSPLAMEPPDAGFLETLEMRAIASVAVLASLIGVIGFGAWSLLQEVQQVKLTPAENTPIVLSDLDPLGSVQFPQTEATKNALDQRLNIEKLDRLYRPQALDFPILTARDAPISSLNPSDFGNFIPQPDPAADPGGEILADVEKNLPSEAELLAQIATPQVLETAPPTLALFAIRDAWVRVTAPDGSRIFENTMKAGEEFILPQTEMAPMLRAGMSGSVYFAVEGKLYGPAGTGGKVVKNVELSARSLMANYQPANLDLDPVLERVVAEATVSSFTTDRMSE
ncbi:helix-turn-helix domain-containing protein [Paracoccaceae bacterium]|jgi:hypothetical protein|nr:helix-turn-helix domain-containing protein [Paracoccaceae bacterium]